MRPSLSQHNPPRSGAPTLSQHVDESAPANAQLSRATRAREYAPHALFILAVLAALAGGISWLVSKPTPHRVEIIIPTAAPVVVQVSGAVAAPGVYALPPGSRVGDAVATAGGFAGADAAAINMARILDDEEHILVPQRTSAALLNGAPSAPQPASAVALPEGEGPAQVAQASSQIDAVVSTKLRLDLNVATADQLVALPEIGPALAARIIEFRSAVGHITRLSQLLEVTGIGPATVAAIQPFVLQQ